MESKFNLLLAQKRGMANVSHSVDYLIGGLITVVLTATLAGTIFSYLGTGSVGLGNSSVAPGTPSWLPGLLIVIVAVGIVYLILRAMGITGKK